jgi:hypothetical protein
MKKILSLGLFSIAIFTTAFTQQQPENPGFESWETISGLTVQEPVNWSSIKTSDGGSVINQLAPYVWDKSTDAHTGTYSVKLFNVTAPIGGIIVSGIVTNGRIHAELSGTGWAFTDTGDERWRTALTQKPDSVVIWAKYITVGGDVAQVKALLHTGSAKIPDAAQTNWISLAQIDIANATPTWTRFSAPFNYFNSTTPQYILFVVSSAGTSAHVGSIAYFDDIELIYNEPELDLTVFLQGPYAGGNLMSTSLNPEYLPLNQPFNTNPWDYNGTESVTAIPNSQVVDWVLIDLRDAASAATATGSTTIAKKAGFLLNDGSVVGLDGTGRLTSPLTISQNLFVVVWHRNHLGILSAIPLVKTNGVYSYNFSDASTKVYGGTSGYLQLESGFPELWGMAGGDGNADGIVNDNDKNNFWSILVGTRGYLQGDYNLNGHINNPDKNDIWLNNQIKQSQVPN